jgi:hypothetical protein
VKIWAGTASRTGLRQQAVQWQQPSRFAVRLFPGIFAEYNFADFIVFEEDKVVLNFDQSVLTKRAGFALRFSEFNKDYRTKICVSVVLVIHL